MCKTIKNIISSVEFWKIIIPASVAIFVAYESHQLAVSRQIEAQKLIVSRQINEQIRKHRIDYLISSFNDLMMFSNNPDKQEGAKHLRDAAISTQFLGSSDQIEKMRTVLDIILNKPNEVAELDPLLISLRTEIRNYLDLEPVSGGIYWLHPRPDNTEKPQQ